MAPAGAVTEVSSRPFNETASYTPARSGCVRSYRPDIDGLRAIAILAVVLHHVGIAHITGGFTGVDIFFVISGYLIGGQIYSDLQQGRFSYLRFYQRRAGRILPAFLAALALTLIAGLILLSPMDLAKLGRSAFAAAMAGSNILFWHGANYFDTCSEQNPLLMTWSLGVEEQFYVSAPILLVLVSRFQRNRALAAVLAASTLSFLFSWIVLARDPAFAFYMLPARAWELGIGVALAIALAVTLPYGEIDRGQSLLSARLQSWASFMDVALMVAPIFLLNSTTPFPGPSALPSVVGAGLAIASPASWINRRFLSARPLVFIGRVSYSWYLWHWPVLAFLRIVYGSQLPAALALSAIAASFAAAVLSYFFIEQPFRASRRAPAPLLIRYALVIAITAVGCAIVWRSRGLPQRYPALARMEDETARLVSDPCLADDGSDNPSLTSPCFDSPNSRAPDSRGSDLRTSNPPTMLALWGDSHAAALAPGLRSFAAAHGYRFAELAKASCPPALGATHFVPRHPQLAAECVRYNQAAFNILATSPQIRIVILHASWAGYLHRSWQDGWLIAGPAGQRTMPPPGDAEKILAETLAETIDALQAAGKTVIVFDDIPTFAFEPIWKFDTAQIPARHAVAKWIGANGAVDSGFAPSRSDDAVAAASSLLRQSAAASPPAIYFDPTPQFCNAGGQCIYRDRDHLLYSDNNHLSAEGAYRALKGFRPPSASSN